MAFISGFAGGLSGNGQNSGRVCSRVGMSLNIVCVVPQSVQIPNSPSELFRQSKQFSTGGRTGAAVLERPVVEEQVKSPKTDPGKMYKVFIYNDEKHSKSYVVSTLMRIIPDMTKDRATQAMEIAHKEGSAMVGVWIFEVAEMYCDMLRTAGIQSDIIQA
uniref:Adaptor protein ClpS core domain-containing protein n=1 Tax=Timspurckia oligopyrenoides TaxID=708627 RepID=A0A7S0ZF67_9RHOD|mmetsp:Transcript_302/g.558  ORF Transcript_302/g.558 Transcript_302/m.558 type:complete len:160 (+) Transcript_302:71-550(+)